VKREVLDRVVRARAGRRALAVLTELGSGRQTVLEPDAPAPAGVDEAVLAAAREAFASDRSRTVEAGGERGGERWFVHVFNPALRMHVVGAVHIAQALAPMAGLAGYDVTVIDPRRAFASDARFPHVRVITEWPDEALARLAPDARSAVVTLTHDPKLDDAALEVALASDAFYIGALGSKRTHAARLERLAGAGFDRAALARIHGPAGLAIGARSPAEIALSILAQATEALRRGGAG